ncbi:UNVERIFIED_CONTAM: hypothetical protein GTU68_063085 [Idotea baltica]|nr:hypothetical protein [Idotea baltica]
MYRKDFPIFRHNPHTYLDSAATTHKPKVVLDALSTFYAQDYGTVHRGIYRLSQESTDQFERTRTIVASFINADSDEIIFTSGATEGTNIVAHSFLAPLLQSGDEIVISVQEHHANYVPWQQLALRNGLRLRVARLDSEGKVDVEHVKELVNAQTRFMAFSHVSNVLGNVNPISELIVLGHKVGAKVLIDAAQSIGHMSIDIQDFDCDFLVFSGHKIYGPTGTGVLYANKDLMRTMSPYRFGGEMIMQVQENASTFKEGPQRFAAGTPNIAGIIGMGASINYIKEIGIAKIAAHEKKLTQRLVTNLQGVGIQILGGHTSRASLVSFLVDDIHPHDVASILDQDGISVRAGHHCAQPLHRHLQLSASVRASFGIYNDEEDIARLMEGIKKVRKLMQ